jgi:hypothetical protein
MVIDFEAIGKPRAVGVVQPKTWERRTWGRWGFKNGPKSQKLGRKTDEPQRVATGD